MSVSQTLEDNPKVQTVASSIKRLFRRVHAEHNLGGHNISELGVIIRRLKVANLLYLST